MENWHKNLETIARGKGSPQARDAGCRICREDEEEKDYSQACQDEPDRR